MNTIAGSYDYVYIDATGAAADYTTVNRAVSLSGKVVIVNRGSLSFSEKGNNAASVSSKALIVANNEAGSINMSLDDYTGKFPMVSITLADAETIKANQRMKGCCEACKQPDSKEKACTFVQYENLHDFGSCRFSLLHQDFASMMKKTGLLPSLLHIDGLTSVML